MESTMQCSWRFTMMLGLLALGTWWFSGVRADEQAQPVKGHATRVALVDMARLFNEYPRFNELRDQLRKEIEAAQADLTSRIEALKQRKPELKEFPSGSPEYKKLEQELLASAKELDAEKKKLQAEFFQKESDMYNSCYRTVRAEVVRHAEMHGIDLVLRFNRQENEENDKPEEVMKRLQAQVIYHAGLDITDDVLAALR
jgi:outer membrane protein